MAEDRRKMNKQSTGTVPKTKCRNNTSYRNEQDGPRSWTNNLTQDFQRLNLSEYLRNSRRNLPPGQHPNYCTMNTTLEEQASTMRQINTSMNGTLTPNTSSSSTSRRNSSGTVPKCDNITKCPDKKQIEDKLSQIREYLQITTSLMSTMKNTDDQSNATDTDEERENLAQMINDLKDSERKLVDILDAMHEMEAKTNEIIEKNEQIIENGLDGLSDAGMSNSQQNELDDKVDHTNREMDILRDQQMTLMSLQQKAQNKLRTARQIQDKLLMSQYGNDVNNTSNQRDKNYDAVDAAIKELEERSKRLKDPGTQSNLQDKLLAEVDSLHNQIVTLHNVNEDRQQLIEVLDNRDAELQAQHQELQSKLSELQNRKLQVDQLVSQLQNLDEAEDDDVGGQVRKIVMMKDQLSKLKDMLDIVKTTENAMQNGGATQEEQDLACAICNKADNFLQKDGDKFNQQPTNDNNVTLRYDNTGVLNESRRKQVNKNSVPVIAERQGGFGGAMPRVGSNNVNKLVVQAELEAKKRELEEIMGKHKAGTSNLNHDVGINDTKSEFSCSSNNAFFDAGQGWTPLTCEHNRFDSSERYSSDDCPEDVNEYSDLNTGSRNQSFSLPVLNYPNRSTSKTVRKHQSEHGSDYMPIPDCDVLSSSRVVPDRNVRSNSVAASYCRERPRSNSEQDNNKNQVQKQLELIRSVCDSMIEQQQQPTNNGPANMNMQQLRNNLTPSPIYSEPRRFASPNPHSMNALNVINPSENPWGVNNNNNQNQQQQDSPNNYQNWLATNTLQTQVFMLNTLNQCCQMLWLQQRELVALRQSVLQLQDRGEPGFDGGSLASPLQAAPVPPSGEGRSTNQYRSSNQKANPNHVASACSMPNLNQYNIPSVNLDPSYANNMQNPRLLDPCLNNANLNTLQNGEHINNSLLHGVNANINHHAMPNQMWNGQALNNQVAPGNRANNYWDNFRSYSRQNLLSTKSNEGLQNMASSLERSNNPFALMSTSIKSNSAHTSANTSQENTPHRRTQFRPLRHTDNTRSNSAAVPDVLNVNHNVTTKINEHNNPIVNPRRSSGDDSNNVNYQMYLNNAFPYTETSSNNSNISEEHVFKDCVPDNARRNEWHEDQEESKSKLFEELRENVYKEVVTLITANESHPHFLIQLFRDLQMVSSDPLRLKILQSIQTVITHSLVSSTQISRQLHEQPQPINEQVLPDCFSLQPTVWAKSPKNPVLAPTSLPMQPNDNLESMEDVLKELMSFLQDHEEESISPHLLMSLKQVLVQSEAFKLTVRDDVFKKHFSNVLDEVLTQFHGKKIQNVKWLLMQAVHDILCGELSFIQLIQDTCPGSCENPCEDGIIFEQSPNLVVNNNGQQPSNEVPQTIQNGDLAEADQGRVEDDDVEEEGAVGGFWDQIETPNAQNPINSEEADVPNVEFQNNSESQTQFIKQGLDQVPTRLPTKSRSNTPSRDRSTSSRSDHPEPF